MLASVYSYRVMVESTSSCCVRGRWVLSSPVTYVCIFTAIYTQILNIKQIKDHDIALVTK